MPRHSLLAGTAAAVLLASGCATLASDAKHHALSLVGAPKYAADFKHFDWVNPNAPKGGALRQFAEGSFDSINPFSFKGQKASDLGLLYDALMVDSPDEASTQYCLICEWVSYPADFSSVTFKLRPEARFSDGKPITVEDVIYSLEAQKKANRQAEHYYKNVVKAEKTGDNEVTFTFDTKGNRELPHIVGQLNVLPKHYWEGKDANGTPRDITGTTLEPPVGSGAYRIKDVAPGRAITYERVPDYWAKDLPVMRGQWNFDLISVDYFRERTAGFETFKTGRLDVWNENVAKDWMTAYDFPAVKNGQIKKERYEVDRVAPMQAFVFNMRRPQFQDARVRQAFNLAFDFEHINKQLLYNMYVRTESFFDHSELKASGLPAGRELEILKEVQAEIPSEVFTTEYKNPVNASPEARRANLRKAAHLLDQAGWKRDPKATDTLLRDASGQTLKAEILLGSPTFERHTLTYLSELKLLGIDATLRVVDSAQYQRRRRTYDFDITFAAFGQSESPGNEQRYFWGSAAADQEGGANTIGIKNPAIDKLIDRVIFAKDRAELVAATKALDRVLLWNHYVVPHWHYPYERIVYWDKYRHPDKLPSRAISFERVWWYDDAAAKKLGEARSQ
ncbi:MAG TPA: extracellular solute-binding protein [Hyphomicrobiaceae bacterium]|nr:extracellular solute-binding protein [Hyphomicrobiaceae bacterium]